MKIAIFENEYETVENAFRYMSIKFFNDALKFVNFPRSDSISDISDLKGYDLIIVDLDLSAESKLDGFGLIKEMERFPGHQFKILILTGQQLADDYDLSNGLSKKYPVLEKPINYKKLFFKFNEIGFTPS